MSSFEAREIECKSILPLDDTNKCIEVQGFMTPMLWTIA